MAEASVRRGRVAASPHTIGGRLNAGRSTAYVYPFLICQLSQIPRIIRALPVALTPGTRLGPYEVVSALGAGGMGEVYRAHDPRLHREVAVKVLLPTFSADPERLRRFEQEARAA